MNIDEQINDTLGELQFHIVEMEPNEMIELFNSSQILLSYIMSQNAEVKKEVYRMLSKYSCMVSRDNIRFLKNMLSTLNLNFILLDEIESIQNGGAPSDSDDDEKIDEEEDNKDSDNEIVMAKEGVVEVIDAPPQSQIIERSLPKKPLVKGSKKPLGATNPNPIGGLISLVNALGENGFTPEQSMQLLINQQQFMIEQEKTEAATQRAISAKARASAERAKSLASREETKASKVIAELTASEERFSKYITIGSGFSAMGFSGFLVYFLNDIIKRAAEAIVNLTIGNAGSIAGTIELTARNAPAYITNLIRSTASAVIKTGYVPEMITSGLRSAEKGINVASKTITGRAATEYVETSITTEVFDKFRYDILQSTDLAIAFSMILIFVSVFIMLFILFVFIFKFSETTEFFYLGWKGRKRGGKLRRTRKNVRGKMSRNKKMNKKRHTKRRR
jgi:hypothetical protein